jgi:hypothetical protein
MREGGVQIIECGLQVDESADTAPVSLVSFATHAHLKSRSTFSRIGTDAATD